MKSLFSENRMANLLVLLRRSNALSIGALASILNVSERSIRNDIKQINDEMEDCAVIDTYQGNYILRIYREDIYREKFSKMIQDDNMLNSPRNRLDYIFGKLMRASEPVLTDELAYEMNVGRTTMVSDLKRLRSELEEYNIEIVGKTSKGLNLLGAEIDIRRYILETNYDIVYGDYPMDEDVLDILYDTMDQYSFDKDLKKQIVSFTTLMLDRFLTGHYIGELTDQYYNLTSRKEYQIIDSMMNEFSKALRVEIPVEERLYVFLPVLGMRTPTDIKDIELIALDDTIRPLMESILAQIKDEMNITISSGELTEEFLYHMMFMINRLRFHVKVTNPLLDDLWNKYPLACQMAEIASRVIQNAFAVQVSKEEKGFLAFYFEVFLAKHDERKEKPFTIAVVCGTGRVTARLVSIQLRKIVDSSTEVSLFSEEKVTADILNDFDLILTTVDLNCRCHRPVIRINEIFNEQELLHKIEKIKYWDDVEVPLMDNNWFVMSGLIDESRFFYLKDFTDYDAAVSYMVDSLTEDGQLDEDFSDRLAQREQIGTMVFDKSIAIPHCIQYEDDRIVMAIGVLEHPVYKDGQEISLIFLMGIPELENGDEDFLIRVYDELMTIATDDELKDRLKQATTFHELIRALYRHA